MKKIPLLLLLITGIAFLLRVWGVGSNPPSISWDEASIGYNAYSVLKTLRDEHGRLLPLDTFTAFGDYKPPIPIYLTVPFIALFGLSEIAVRLPSALAGVGTVYLTYILMLELLQITKKINHKKKTQKRFHAIDNTHEALPMITAFLLAVSPWHIMLSRAGFEGNIAVFFMVLGAVLLLKARSNQKLLSVCFLPFVAGMYTFNSSRYFAPLFAGVLFLFASRDLLLHKKKLILGVIIAFLALLPIIPHLASPQSRLRFSEVSIFNDLSTVIQANERMQVDGNPWWGKVIHNRRIGYIRNYLLHFFDHFSPRFLFVSGDGNPKFSIQDVGQMYLIEAPFLLLGIASLFSLYPRLGWLLIVWLLLAIAPAAVARETPHALRTENSLPVWQICTAFGIVAFLQNAKHVWQKYGYIIIVSALYFGSIVYFLYTYTYHYPKEYSGEWQYGYKQAIEYVSKQKEQYDHIVITESIGRPYIYVLFYERYNPRVFLAQKDAGFDAAGFYNVKGFGKYRFVREDVGQYQPRTLYVLPFHQVPANARVLHTVYLLNGEPKLVLFDTGL